MRWYPSNGAVLGTLLPAYNPTAHTRGPARALNRAPTCTTLQSPGQGAGMTGPARAYGCDVRLSTAPLTDPLANAGGRAGGRLHVVELVRTVVAFDAANLHAESAFWASVFGGHVVEDDTRHQRHRRPWTVADRRATGT